MAEKIIHTLLIEDDNRFVELLLAWLEDIPLVDIHHHWQARLAVHHAETLDHGLGWLDQQQTDILLADLNLPDSQGLATCDCLLAHEAHPPLIVLSGLDDESLAIQAVRRGAQDYLVKSRLDGHQLVRSVYYALERHRLQQELELARAAQMHRREQETLDRMNERVGSPVAAQALGLQNLDQAQPELFNRLAERLTTTLERKLEMRTHKVVHNISGELRELAQELSVLKCGPRDVVALYRAAGTRLYRPNNPRRHEAIQEEGRYLAFELIGLSGFLLSPLCTGKDPSPRRPGARSYRRLESPRTGNTTRMKA